MNISKTICQFFIGSINNRFIRYLDFIVTSRPLKASIYVTSQFNGHKLCLCVHRDTRDPNKSRLTYLTVQSISTISFGFDQACVSKINLLNCKQFFVLFKSFDEKHLYFTNSLKLNWFWLLINILIKAK